MSGNQQNTQIVGQISKLMEKFFGDGDLNTSMPKFEQVCEAMGEQPKHLKITAFGLSLDGKAGMWFRALTQEEMIMYKGVKKLFLRDFQ